jgi:hypothetical protein
MGTTVTNTGTRNWKKPTRIAKKMNCRNSTTGTKPKGRICREHQKKKKTGQFEPLWSLIMVRQCCCSYYYHHHWHHYHFLRLWFSNWTISAVLLRHREESVFVEWCFNQQMKSDWPQTWTQQSSVLIPYTDDGDLLLTAHQRLPE